MRRRVLARLRRRVEQDLQEIRRADIARRPQMRDRLELLLGIAGAGGDDRAAERVRARLHDEAARREMIGEGIVHDVAGRGSRRRRARAPRSRNPCPAPSGSKIGPGDISSRRTLPGRRDVEAAERRDLPSAARTRSDLRSTGSLASAAREVTALGSTPARCRAQPGALRASAMRSGRRPKNSRSRSSRIAGFERVVMSIDRRGIGHALRRTCRDAPRTR